MVRGLSWGLIGLFAIMAAARADDSEIVGRVFERLLTRAEFNERLAFLTRHLDARAEPDQLWRRLALLESAARMNLQVSPAAQRREEDAVIRQASIAARLRERWPETPKSSPELELYEAESLRLQKEFRLEDSDRKTYFENRKLSPEEFSRFIREQLTLTGLRQLASEGWKLEERAFEKAGARLVDLEIEVFSLGISALPELKAEAPSEATLRATYERDPLRFRRPREVAVEGLKRVDDGDLRRFAEIHKAIAAGAELSQFFQEPGATRVQHERRPLDDSPENDWMGTEAIRDFCQRAPLGELSPVLRQGGFQWLLRVTEARPAGRASFEEARARIEAEWLTQARMGALLERAHAWLRDLSSSWSFAAGPGRQNLGRHRLSAAAPRGDWPPLLRGRALEIDRGEAALCPDLAQRRVLLFKVLERRLPDRGAIPKESLSKLREPLERRAAAEWQARVALEARRIGPAAIEYSSQLLAPATIFVLRQMSVTEDEWSPTIAAAFAAGESLEAIASRLGRRSEPLGLELFEKPGPLAALASRCEEGEVAGPIRVGGELHIVMTARRARRGFGGDVDQASWRAVYHLMRRCPAESASIEKAFEDLSRVARELRAAPGELRLSLFQRLARTRSEAPSAVAGGLLGGIAEPKAERRSLGELLALSRAGERHCLRSADKRLLVTILDERKPPDGRLDWSWMSLDELADWSLPKD